MDEMKIKSSFMKALLSSVIAKLLRSKGLAIDICIDQFEMVRSDEDKKLKLTISATGECTDDDLEKLLK
jgi:hypothetical protein